MLELGYATRKDKRDIRKKNWIRYERRHSLTAVHIDWHYDGTIWFFAVIDDASRKILLLLSGAAQQPIRALRVWKKPSNRVI